LYTINIKKLKFIFKNIFATIRNLFKYSISGYAGDLLNFFSYRGDIFILAYFTNIAAVGYYTLAVSFAELIFILPNSIALILFPHYSKIENRTNSQLAVIFSKFSFYVLIFFCIFLVIFSNIFIQIFFGTRYSESIQLMIIILPGIYFMSINKIYSSYFMGIGKPKIPMFISLVTIILTLTFDFILIPIFGAKGAAYSSDIGYIISFIISTMVFINNSGIKFSELFLVKKSDINNLKNALSFK
jgi:O-antigen/teichoic acid export membrane protein